MSVETVSDLFEHELEDIYFAEHELIEAYERMAAHADDEEVQQFFEAHASETGTHVERLIDVFEETGEPPQTEECEGVEGLLAEWEEFLEENESGPLMDYYHLVTAVKTERYEQTAYESLVDLAEQLDRDVAAEILRENLNEDEETIVEIRSRLDGFDHLASAASST
jgi:ferritin-like metal-binding protein YciE